MRSVDTFGCILVVNWSLEATQAYTCQSLGRPCSWGMPHHNPARPIHPPRPHDPIRQAHTRDASATRCAEEFGDSGPGRIVEVSFFLFFLLLGILCRFGWRFVMALSWHFWFYLGWIADLTCSTFSHEDGLLSRFLTLCCWWCTSTKDRPSAHVILRRFKRDLCVYWQQGTCQKGSACTFAHGSEELVDHTRGGTAGFCGVWLVRKRSVINT